GILRHRRQDIRDLNVLLFPDRQEKPDPASQSSAAWVQIGAAPYSRTLREFAEERTPERQAALAKDPVVDVARRFDPALKPPADWGDDLEIMRRQLPDLLPDLARAFGVDIISDSYW